MRRKTRDSNPRTHGPLPNEGSSKVNATEVVSIGFIPFGSRAAGTNEQGLPLERCESETLRRIVDYLENDQPWVGRRRNFLFFTRDKDRSVWQPYPSTVKRLLDLDRNIRKVGKNRQARRSLFAVATLMQVVANLQAHKLLGARWRQIIGGRTGGQNKSANRSGIRERRNDQICKKWRAYRREKDSRNEKPTVEKFWPLNAQDLFDELKKTDREVANSLRGKDEHGFLTVPTVRKILTISNCYS